MKNCFLVLCIILFILHKKARNFHRSFKNCRLPRRNKASMYLILLLYITLQIKQFLKSCSVANYTKKMRQLLEKIEENSRFIESKRAKVTFALNNTKMVKAWETSVKTKGTPLMAFFENWNKINKIQKRKKVSKNDELAGNLPSIKRPRISEELVAATNVKPESKGPLVLFPSDSEEDKDNFNLDEEDIPPKAKKVKKVKKKKVVKNKVAVNDDSDKIPDEVDVVQDFCVSDW